MIERFARTAADKIGCDKELAERLRLEILDHLSEAAQEEQGSVEEAERAAIRRFGEPQMLARDYVPVVQLRRGRSTRNMAILAIAVVFATMRLRTFVLPGNWYEAIVSSIWGQGLMFVDRYAFILAMLVILCDMLCEKHCRFVGGGPSQSFFGLNRVFVFPLAGAVLIGMSAGAGIISAVFSQMETALRGAGSLPQQLYLIPLLVLIIAVGTQLYRHVTVFNATKIST